MEGTEQALQTGVFGLGLWLKCALAGAAIGGVVAAVQIFPGRWHPAWARRLVYWFSCPLFSGMAIGVVVALFGVPPLSNARGGWLLLCLVVGGFTALITAGAIAFLSRNYDPDVVSKAKRATRRSSRHTVSRTEEWEDRLRALFRPPATAVDATKQESQDVARPAGSHGATTIPGQKAKLPPERYPISEVSVKVPRYAGKPLRAPGPEPKSQGRLEKPIK